ncbi:MAG: DNA gyrase subunit B [Candidatus Dependentiae bacterium ADurb.Bin331]|nr:MAG: DNA gyrase subunit B [Candidatus Dependentiae bacterium ADurb.Bin331]
MAKDHQNDPNSTYSAKSIQVIEGLEAVRKRPAMYIGSTGINGLHHLVYEIVDNSVDEALGGHCNTVTVTLHADGSCSVEDNGRGIPTDIHPTEKVSAAEVVLTKLHAGGKFDKESYKYSGGLHGVGVSVVNALSRKLELEIYRDGKIYSQTFEKGKPLAPLKVVGETKKRGTYIRFYPDAEIFTETTTFSFDTLAARLRELAFLNKKLTIFIIDELNNKKHEFYFEGGIVSFIEFINSKKTAIFPEVIHFQQENDQYILEIALQYNDGFGEQLFSFVNNINTVEGGTHVTGFKTALTKVSNKRGQELNILKDGETFSSEDVREGLVCVINIKVPEPQFEGQTKTKLGNNEIKGIVDSWTFAALDTYFEEHPTITKAILQKADLAKRARDAAKKARDLTRRKTALEGLVLPGKLADCANENPADTELFIVEGDSAGGSAKQGRDRHNQAILPLKGKILNVEKARLDKMLSNDEIKALISAIGCGIGSTEFDVNKARYHKIILMTDADVDGSHIRTLLLTLFFRYMQPLIEKGYLYIAQPPLYKAKIGKKEEYLKDEKSFKQFLFEWAQEQTTLTINGKELSAPDWEKILADVRIYEQHIMDISHTFKVTYDNAHQLVLTACEYPWNKEIGLELLVENLKKKFKKYQISTKVTTPSNTEVGELTPESVRVVFKLLTREWSVDVQFFSSPELPALLEALKPLMILEQNDWTLQVTGKDKKITDRGIFRLIYAISAISKPYMNIQRYKGLGEMNPEQLWETSMNNATRTLLQVKIEDALEADAWFSTLMGDDVAGRRDYIEQNGQFVKNLDV